MSFNERNANKQENNQEKEEEDTAKRPEEEDSKTLKQRFETADLGS
jgi:hypothetical protein